MCIAFKIPEMILGSPCCYPEPVVQPGYTPSNVPGSALFLPLNNKVQTTPVQYSAWDMPMFHDYTQVLPRSSTARVPQSFSVPWIDKIYSELSADPVMDRHLFAWPHQVGFGSYTYVRLWSFINSRGIVTDTTRFTNCILMYCTRQKIAH
jgi:hypothetical protein